MNKKGFTLIELLAVIVILAIILLIVMPIVLNVINDARKGAFQASAYGLMKTAENKCLSDLVQNYDGTAEIVFDEGSIITGELDFSGKGPQTGTISVNSQCEIALAIHDGTWCAVKEYNDNEITLTTTTVEECNLGTVCTNSFASCGDIWTDTRDCNEYPTVDINGQCWMAKNLAYLPAVSGVTTGSQTDPIYYVFSYQGEDVEEAKANSHYEIHGVLYNWPAAVTACPGDWRLATDAEWHALETYLTDPGQTCSPTRSGTWGCASAGTKLKHASYDGNNSSGFSAIRGGYRSSGEWFGWLEVLAWYWTATEFDATNATTRTLSNNPPDEIRRRSADNKAMGFTVRCFLDD